MIFLLIIIFYTYIYTLLKKLIKIKNIGWDANVQEYDYFF